MAGGSNLKPEARPEVSLEFALAYVRLQDHELPGQVKAVWGPLDEAVLRSLQKEIFRLRQLLGEGPTGVVEDQS